MSVYKEGFYCIKVIQQAQTQIFDDACDFGAPAKKGDAIWNAAAQLVEWYRDKDSNKRKVERYSTGVTVTDEVELMDEWAVSDERKTVAEATERYRVTYNSCTTGKCKGKDGFFYIEKL